MTYPCLDFDVDHESLTAGREVGILEQALEKLEVQLPSQYEDFPKNNGFRLRLKKCSTWHRKI